MPAISSPRTEIRARWRLPKPKTKDFALAMTDHNIKDKNLRGSYKLNEEVVKNSRATRHTLLSRGIRPESLKPQEDLKKICYT